MYRLTTFYQHRDWRTLLDVLRLERTRGGVLSCEYCGKPIVRKYDMIGHHVIPLTEENVNDTSISLNPNNIQLVHHACHNKIHNKLHYERTVWVVWGSPLSGKSSYVRENMSEGDLIVDMDNIWQCISGLDRYTKPPALNAVAFGVRDTLLESIKYRRGKWRNAWVIGGYPFSVERERIINSLGAREIHIDTSYDECMNRYAVDLERKKEWEGYINDWWDKFDPRFELHPPTY